MTELTKVLAKSAGVVVTITVKENGAPLNIAAASVKQFRLKPKHPKGVPKKVDASFVTNGTDGKLKYTTQATTFDVVGDWDIQAYLVTCAYAGYTTAATITVLDVIEA